MESVALVVFAFPGGRGAGRRSVVAASASVVFRIPPVPWLINTLASTFAAATSTHRNTCKRLCSMYTFKESEYVRHPSNSGRDQGS
jgi:hypothetical protein